MATRAKQARVSSTVAFTGRVREWEQQHVTIAQGLGADTKHSGLQVLRWVPNGKRTEQQSGSRRPDLAPIPKASVAIQINKGPIQQDTDPDIADIVVQAHVQEASPAAATSDAVDVCANTVTSQEF